MKYTIIIILALINTGCGGNKNIQKNPPSKILISGICFEDNREAEFSDNGNIMYLPCDRWHYSLEYYNDEKIKRYPELQKLKHLTQW